MDFLPSCCIFLISLTSFFFKFGLATTNSITTNKFLNSSRQLVSNNGEFMMGFFNSPNSKNYYVGIWYNNKKNSDSDRMSISDVIWIANRDNPLKDHYGVLKVSKEGNLQLIDGKNMIIWSTNISNNQENNSTSALLEDTGNLVLFSNVATIWQSFDFPVNSLLPSAVYLAVDYTKKKPILQSWKNDLDPSSGKFTLYIIPHAVPEIKTWDGARPYWRSGPWSSNLFFGVPFLHSDVVTGFDISTDHQSKLYITYTTSIPSLLEHLELRYDGNLIQKFWENNGQKWDISWQSIESDCDIYGKCGPFGICNPKKSPICSCLKGFKPSNADEWRKGNYTRGCVRKIPLQCGTSTTGAKPDGFHMNKDTKVPDNPRWFLERNLDDCERKCLVNCSCLAFSYYSGKGCMLWSESLMDMQQSSDFNNTDVFFRLADAEFGEPIKWKLIVVTIVGILCAMTLFLFMYYAWKRIRQRYGWKNTNKLDIQLYNILDDRVNDFQDLPLFEFQKLEVATNFFSAKNKIGQGGFGPVYKGKLEDGKEIAVKRLSRSSGQGLQEFMNEVVVISKLQHKNLVRLLGCCIEREEKVLVYEYMPNKSLDAILFDPNYRKQLDWKKRFSIVKGICRGLLYLHRDSRLKIIHRDLKASNILLDEELNPKISDFGMARIFGTKQDQANTLRVVGTYGYMSPEYAMEGRFSEKSDVFSLGVLLLEIINGRKNNSFAASESMSLLSYAWKLWNENDILSFVDPTIYDSCFEGQVLKCIQLGLLCVQEHPEDRPTISALTSMIDVEDDTDLPQPKQPGFTQMIRCTDYSTENGSVNHVSLTVLSGR